MIIIDERIIEALINEVSINEQVELNSALNTIELNFKESINVEVNQELLLKLK